MMDLEVYCSTAELHLSATTPMELCHTLQRLHVSVAKTMGAPVQTGCIATHQNPNAKQYPIRFGFRPAIRQTIPTLIPKFVAVVPTFVYPRPMDRIASRPSAVAVALPVNLESIAPTAVKFALRVRLRLLSVWWVDALDALPVNLAQQLVKQPKRRVKIAVLEKPRTCLAQPANRLAMIV
jgi:hypothetical protein